VTAATATSIAAVDRRTLYGAWLPGVTLIALGLVFLAQTWFGLTLRNWWAVFILVAAFGSFATAYELWQSGRSAAAGGSIVPGLGLAFLAALFLFDLEIGRLWPVLLIVAGAGLLVSRREVAG
jgi:hypothetical protein